MCWGTINLQNSDAYELQFLRNPGYFSSVEGPRERDLPADWKTEDAK